MWEAPDTDGTPRGRILLIVPQDTNMADIDQTYFAPPKGWRLALQTLPLSHW
jgi:hypothetical protein